MGNGATLARLAWGQAGDPARGRRRGVTVAAATDADETARRDGGPGHDDDGRRREGAGPNQPRATIMQLDDNLAREMQRGIEDIGTHARAASIENKQYVDARLDSGLAELRREMAALQRKQQREVDQV